MRYAKSKQKQRETSAPKLRWYYIRFAWTCLDSKWVPLKLISKRYRSERPIVMRLNVSLKENNTHRMLKSCCSLWVIQLFPRISAKDGNPSEMQKRRINYQWENSTDHLTNSLLQYSCIVIILRRTNTSQYPFRFYQWFIPQAIWPILTVSILREGNLDLYSAYSENSVITRWQGYSLS